MEDGLTEIASNFRDLVYPAIAAARRSSSRQEFRSHIDVLISVCTDYVSYFRILPVFPLRDVLQLCCNRQEDSEMLSHILKGIESSYLLTTYLLLSCFLNTCSVRTIQRQRPLLPYLLECAQERRLTINGVKFTELFSLDTVVWNGNEISSLHMFLKYGGWLDLPKHKRQQTMKNLLLQLIQACKASGQWDPETLKKVLPSPINREATEKVNELSQCFQLIVEEEENPCAICTERELYQAPEPVGIPKGNTLLDFYDSLYPQEGYGRNSPGSLEHLSKMKIRRALHENYELPRGVKYLGLPTALENYVSTESP